jgi:hypothetical protein
MKKIKMFLVIAMLALFVWVGYSWTEVVAKNTAENPTYWQYNAFVLLVEAGE